MFTHSGAPHPARVSARQQKNSRHQAGSNVTTEYKSVTEG